MNLKEKKEEAFENAIDSLARYKFMMFGYWSAIWVHLNSMDSPPESNPFRGIIEAARSIQAKYNGQKSMTL